MSHSATEVFLAHTGALQVRLLLLLLLFIIIDNCGLNARWCLTPLLLSLPTAAYLGQRGLTPAGLPHPTAQCHLTILGEAVLFLSLIHISEPTRPY